MKESATQSAIMQWLKGRGIWATKVMSASRAGCPDILACYNGRFLAIEVKSASGKTAPLQEHHARLITASRGIHVVARSVGDVERALFDADIEAMRRATFGGQR